MQCVLPVGRAEVGIDGLVGGCDVHLGQRGAVTSCFIVLSRPNSSSSAFLRTGTWKLCPAVSYILHTNWYTTLSWKNKISSCLAHTFKHCKIRKHQNHSKCLYITCSPVHTKLIIAQSHLSSFSPCWPFHKISAWANTQGVNVQHSVRSPEPGLFREPPKPCIEMIHFLICFPMELSLYYLIPWSLKACWYWTRSTLRTLDLFFRLVYVVIFLVSRKIEDIVPV